LKRALRPDLLRDGVDFGIELEVLCRPLLRTREKPRLWPLLRHEIRALERLDVPYFTSSTASDSLRLGPNEVIEDCFLGPSYEQVMTRLRNLDDDDLERQVGIIRGSLETVSRG
jgi:lantibiotic modifying enzyme